MGGSQAQEGDQAQKKKDQTNWEPPMKVVKFSPKKTEASTKPMNYEPMNWKTSERDDQRMI